MFECKRSCSVQSENYATLAKVGRPEFLEICRKFPVFIDEMLNRISNYTDPDKYLIQERLQRIPLY